MKKQTLLKKSLTLKKQQKGKRVKILTAKQMLQRLPIDLTGVKAGNTSEDVLNEIHQIIYSLYQAKKKYTKEVHNDIMNSIKV